jgi:membrane fusion protein, heavy metal efflux system
MIARPQIQVQTVLLPTLRTSCAAYVPAALFMMLAACSGRDTKQAKEHGDSASAQRTTAASGAMADMSGMNTTTGGSSGAESGGAKEGGAETSNNSVAFTAAQVQHGKVRWAPAGAGAASVTVAVPGQLAPNEDRTARLGAPARGRVLTVRVQPGDRVTRGQLLVTLESPEAGMAQSDVAKAQAELTSRRAQAQYAKTARERAERLLILKAIPRQDYDRAIADDEAARAGLAQAGAELRRARSTADQLGAGAAANGVIAINSPLAGVVLSRTAAPGTVVEPGAPLVVVTDPTTLWLQVNAPEKFAALFRRGATLRFTVPAYPGQTFSARTDAVGAGLDPDTRTLPVRATVASDGRLKAEMLATVTLEGGQGTVAAVVVPDDAVQTLNGKTVVFIATPDGKGGAEFVAREVKVASRSGGRIVITRGISAGELVVTAGAFAVKAQITKSSMPEMEM